MNRFDFKEPNEIALLFEGIAAAPKLRMLNLELFLTDDEASPAVVSSQEVSETFANALKFCNNSSPESVPVFDCGGASSDYAIWYREVDPILKFNNVRRLYKDNQRNCSIRKVTGNNSFELSRMLKKRTIIIINFGWCAITRTHCNFVAGRTSKRKTQ
jgi:hypothetical protein